MLYSGVLAANARWRSRVVPEPAPEQPSACAHADPTAGAPAGKPARPNPDWATLMKRGLDIDVLACPGCGGRMRHVATIHRRDVIRRILRSDPPTFARARVLPLFEPDDRA